MPGPRKRPIGIFDSGLGGLTIAWAINRLLRGEDILFLADEANLPYGDKSEDEILKLTEAGVPTLIAEGAKLVVIACNSASVMVINKLRERYPQTPFVAVVPMVKPAAERTKTGTVAVFATRATLASSLYEQLKQDHAADTNVLDIACPEWVGLVESGAFTEHNIAKPVRKALNEGADQLVLGCTHYPHLRNEIAKIVHNKAEILESGPAVASQVKRILTANEDLATGAPGVVRYLTSADPDRVSQVATRLTGKPTSFALVGH